MKHVLEGDVFFNEKLNLGVVKVNTKAPLNRPYMKEIMRKPTSTIVAKKCDVAFVKVAEERKEEEESLL